MALIGSIGTATSGMSAQQAQLETVADNLANLTTTGFKSARVDFKTMLSETLRLGTAPEGQIEGGFNPLQIGTGVAVASTTRDFSQGAIGATGLSGDAAIDGAGFFILAGDPAGTTYSRDGSFGLNALNQLFDPGTGLLVQGVNADLGTFTIPAGAPLETLVVPIGSLTVGAATLVDFTILSDGTLQGIFSDASTQTLGRLMLARFANPDGLEHVGDTRFRETAASGAAVVGEAGTQGLGTVVGGALEGSNVDFLDEVQNLIEAQQAFQANARVLARSEALLEDFLNLVRDGQGS